MKSLTIKQRRWVKEYIITGNATEAAARVYDVKDRNSANAIGSENLAKLSFPDLMEEMGLSDVALMNIGIEGMQATKPIGALVLVSGDKPMQTKGNEGQIEVPDFAVRHKYWDTMLKLKGKLRDKSDVNIGEAKILVMPTQLIEKYDISQNSSDSSE